MAFQDNKTGLWENELITVRPMDTPSGQLFYMDVVYGETKLLRKCLEEKWTPTDRFL